jgi:N-acyl-D-amino-acid deacylase
MKALLPWLLAICILPLSWLSPAAADPAKLPVTGQDVPELAAFDELMLKFLQDNKVPGAALAIAKDGRLVYARGFGYADPEHDRAVQPRSRFRIASISKPLTAAAIMRLVELGKLKLDDCPFDLLAVTPPPGATPDPRLKKVTIRHLLQHTGGWDRAVSFDPMFRSIKIAESLGVKPPAEPEHVIRYMLGQKLDFEPGSRFAYSNFGYCLLGRLIEKASGVPYETYVKQEVLAPLGIQTMQIGKTLETADGEVRYFDGKKRTGPAVLGPDFGKPVPTPYGVWYLESLDSVGGWIASAPDLVRFATALARPEECKILKADSIRTLFARPAGPPGETKDGQPRDSYYGLGWNVREAGPGKLTTHHSGAFAGTSTLLVRRHDGLCWAVLFNTWHDPRGRVLSAQVDLPLHQAADAVKKWPERGLAPVNERRSLSPPRAAPADAKP